MSKGQGKPRRSRSQYQQIADCITTIAAYAKQLEEAVQKDDAIPAAALGGVIVNAQLLDKLTTFKRTHP